MASKEYHRIREIIASRRSSSGRPVDIEKFRGNMESTARSLPAKVNGLMIDAGGVPGELQATSEASENHLIIYFHGGGYIGGSIATHRNLTGHLARRSNCRVLSVEYRLAPEHPHPAAVEDAVKSYRWSLSEGYEPSNIALAGDSAGGGLAAACLLALKSEGLPLPRSAVLISPWLDMSLSGESMTSNADNDSSISPQSMPRTRELFISDSEIDDPLASPLAADLTGLPPLMIQVGDEEILLSDSTRFADKAQEAGVSVNLRVWPEMFHVWHACVGLFEEASDAIGEMAEFMLNEFALDNSN
ncbi:MAG: alpha/beta hydrolase [Acidimicrobiales bacterium]|nr:alpha/beta hydrolase [Acidimicrobiales bacterium]HAA67097.1 alpha/beta hydrolase [Acidimicrobiaceae bacterium]HCK73501.1 alpha/beta hydrolase [Acidimicrobiaceae bacterium]